jgi:hypothetical protein
MTILNVPLPPMLLGAVGYGGDAGLVALYFGAGDEAYWDDGRGSATGDPHAYLAYVRHAAVAPHLAGYDLGSSDGPAEHWLLIDRQSGTVAVAPVAEARRLLRGQWPADDAPLTAKQIEAAAKLLRQALAGRPTPTAEQVWAALQEQRRLHSDLVEWLDSAAPPGHEERP